MAKTTDRLAGAEMRDGEPWQRRDEIGEEKSRVNCDIWAGQISPWAQCLQSRLRPLMAFLVRDGFRRFAADRAAQSR